MQNEARMPIGQNDDAFGVITLIFAAIGNIINLPWTAWLVAEQIKTGFGFGTDMEMAALLPWIAEVLSLPVIVLGIVYFVTMILKGKSKRFLKPNVIFYALLIFQITITNLFMWI